MGIGAPGSPDVNWQEIVDLTEGWTFARVQRGSVNHPDELNVVTERWLPAVVPGTVAEALEADIGIKGEFDQDEWWYRSSFKSPSAAVGSRFRLQFDGLATLATIWLNRSLILESRNMFVSCSKDVTSLLATENELCIRFGSLTVALEQRRPRPRWKTALVENQNLRWYRTTLLGRIPGWTPPITPVGPWRPVTLVRSTHVELASIDLQTSVLAGAGRIRLRIGVVLLAEHRIEAASLRLGEGVYGLDVGTPGAQTTVSGDIEVPEVSLWWPHTHGSSCLYECLLELVISGASHVKSLGRIGFKQIEINSNRGLQFVINEIPIFCRGACWTTANFLSLHADSHLLRKLLTAARDAGLNMFRIGGTMVYESDVFYDLCDELGILVWQDFMFANMDYPVDDAEFHADISAEARYQLGRLQRHVCIAAYCGGSEVAQQAAMLGRPSQEWSNGFFDETLPELCAAQHASIPYFPSTPWGGPLPFHVSTGISHYYGVGAYRRQLSDVKHAGVKFTTECLGFSNVPDRETIALMHGGNTLPPHHPLWKSRVPRDSGPGWDFEDIRDFYLRVLFDQDPVQLRSVDLERYFSCSRVVTGEVMQRVFNEWRKADNPCSGGLIWFFQDLWPGAGWGILDSTGRPKAAFWYLKRAWAPRAIRLTDEGLDGLNVIVINDGPESLAADVDICLYSNGTRTARVANAPVEVKGHGLLALQGDALLGQFADISHAYRFGPPSHDVVHVRLHDRLTGALLAEDFFLPGGLALPMCRTADVTAATERDADGRWTVKLTSNTFLQSVCITCNEFEPSDNYFHMAPSKEKCISFKPLRPGLRNLKALFQPLNISEATTVRAIV